MHLVQLGAHEHDIGAGDRNIRAAAQGDADIRRFLVSLDAVEG